MIRNLRRLFPAIVCVILYTVSFAQERYGNEWIEPGKSYLRIPVIQNGIYEISALDLGKAGIDLSTVNPANLQLFRRGKELAVDVKTDAGGALQSIVFYGERNDGMLDTLLYTKPAAIPHTYFSLYSDSAAYFLGWQNKEILGKRMLPAPAASGAKLLPYHFAETVLLFNRYYNVGNFYPPTSNFDNGSVLSGYDTGEGWTGDPVANGSAWVAKFTTQQAIIEEMGRASVELTVVGRAAGQHIVDIFAEDAQTKLVMIGSTTLLNYESKQLTAILKPEYLLSDGSVKISLVPQKRAPAVSMSLARLRYPQKSSFIAGVSQTNFFFEKSEQPAQWQSEGAANRLFYDISDKENARFIAVPGPISLNGVTQLIAAEQPLPILKPKIVTFRKLPEKNTDYLIISHPLLRRLSDGSDPVNTYADYRESLGGGGYHPYLINSEEVYDYFNYGEPGPHGIRKMISWMYGNTSLKFVFLVGQSTDPQSVRSSALARQQDMVPSAGWPGSDLALTMNLRGSGSYIPLVPIGRLNAQSAQQVSDYLLKVKKLDAEKPSAEWRKNILHLSGGRSAAELQVFKEYVHSFESRIRGSSLGANVATLSKKTDEAVEEFPIHEQVNKGVALMTLFGHSSVDVTDIDIGYVSDDRRQYQNEPLFPAVLANGCAVGAIFFSQKALSNDWIRDPHRGAVLFLAHTFNGISANLKHYTDSFYDVLADSLFVSQPFGIIQKEAIRRNMARYPNNILEGITAQQMNLHGDPAIRIFPARLPDYTIQPSSVVFSGVSGDRLSAWSDSLLITFVVQNNGRFRQELVELTIRRKKGDRNDIVYQYIIPAPKNAQQFNFKIPNVFAVAGAETWEFSIDPALKLPEEDEKNNVTVVEYVLPEGGASPLLPANRYTTNARTIELIAQIPSDRTGRVVFEWSSDSTFTNSSKVVENTTDLIARHILTIQGSGTAKLFWRVFLETDEDRPSQSRYFVSDPGAQAPEALPEVVLSGQSPVYPRIPEGGVFRLAATVQNITATSFKDSVNVVVRHFHDNILTQTTNSKLWITGSSKQDFVMNLPTIEQVGEHRINLLFNSTLLPEESFLNNNLNFSYKVYADDIPPILHVKVDSRQLIDGDVVSRSPQIDIQVIDENVYFPREDTTGIEVWLRKECLDCPEKRITLRDGQIVLLPPNNFLYKLDHMGELESGTYDLRVEATDLKGNRAAPYQIRFRITEEKTVTDAGVSPNPSSFNFRFFMDIEGPTPPAAWKLSIFNKSGLRIMTVTPPVHLGRNEWVWKPESLPAGIYIYKMETDDTWHLSDAAQKRLTGKIIWMPTY